MSDVRLHDHLAVVREQSTRPDGRAWLARVPSLIDDAIARWDLEVGEAFDGGSCAFVAPVRRAGEEAVLKITLPHREARYESDALRLWDGDGSVRLLDASDEGFTILVERCLPGVALRDDSLPIEAALRAATEILSRLWTSPVTGLEAFESVDDVCKEWAGLVRSRVLQHPLALDAGLAETGANLLETLPASASRRVLVHGDFNPGNILRAEREPWLAIDPKPMVGDPGYDVWPLAAQLGVPEDAPPNARFLERNFAAVAEIVGEPVERLLAWATARTVESGLWHASLGENEQAIDTMRWARVFAELAGV